jgi:mitochondrial chaperone BCS1
MMENDSPINRLLSLAQTSFLGGITSKYSGDDLLGKAGFAKVQAFYNKWFPFDITTLAFILALLGTVPRALQEVQTALVKLYWWIAKFFTASISIASNDRLNLEILDWLGSEVLTRQDTRVLTATSETVGRDRYRDYDEGMKRDDLRNEKRTPIQYLPTFGTTWFLFGGTVFVVRRIPGRFSDARAGFTATPAEYADAPDGSEPLLVLCLGRSVAPIKRFLEHCRTYADKQREAYITVRATRTKDYREESWDTTILRPIRRIETVHFDESVKQDLIDDIKNYLDPATRSFYNTRGIPYRRGYLLHGPPGTGKTSISLALAGHFTLDLYLLHLPSLKNDNSLETLFAALPPHCIVLIEDIDAVGIPPRDFQDEDEDDFEYRRTYGNRPRSECTLAGLLNVLDGVASQEGRIILMTSNMADKLDKALIRPGRIDKMIFLGHIDQRCAELMFLRMYCPEKDSAKTATQLPGRTDIDDEELQKLALEFSTRIPDQKLTPAQLQGFLLSHRNSPKTAADKVSEWALEEVQKNEEVEQREEDARKKKEKTKSRVRIISKALRGLAESGDSSYDEVNDTDEEEKIRENPEKNEDTEVSQIDDGVEDSDAGSTPARSRRRRRAKQKRGVY